MKEIEKINLKVFFSNMSGRSIREKVLEKGRFIAKGSEAKVYYYQNHAWKLFKPRFVKSRFHQNVKFLTSYSNTNVVPRFACVACAEYGIIRMKYLDEKTFVTLRKVLEVNGLSMEKRKNILQLIWNARCKLPSSIQFCDFKNPANIMIQFSEEHPIGAVFVEGGKEVNCPNALYLFLEMLGELLNVSKTDLFKNLQSSSMQPLKKIKL
mgnify:CR=1 FL=1